MSFVMSRLAKSFSSLPVFGALQPPTAPYLGCGAIRTLFESVVAHRGRRSSFPCHWPSLLCCILHNMDVMWHNPATKATMGTSKPAQPPANPGQCEPGRRSGPKILPERKPKSAEHQRVGETDPSSVTQDADMCVSGEAPEFREAEWYRVSQALVSDMGRESSCLENARA